MRMRTWRYGMVLALAGVLVVSLGLPSLGAGAFQVEEDGRETRQGVRQTTSSPAAAWQVSASELPYKAYLPLLVRSFYSGSTFLGIESPGQLDTSRMEKIRGMQASWVRRNRVSWGAVEPVPGQYDFSSVDALLAGLEDSRLQPIVIVGDNPAWTGATPNGPLPDSSVPAFANFLSVLVSRYQGAPYNVKHWEIYNEPDNASALYEESVGGRWGGQGQAYARMLRSVYPAIKAADPEAKVLIGSLALDWFDTQGGVFDPGFLDAVLAEMATQPGQYFDYMSFHYYPDYDTGPDRWGMAGWNGWDPDGKQRGLVGKTTYIRSRMKWYGIDRPIVCTEVSVSSEEDRLLQLQVRTTGDAAEEQSRYVPKVFVRGAAADLQAMIWYLFVSSGPGVPAKVDFFAYHGLLDYQLQPRPSYTSYRTLAREMMGARFVRALANDETGSPAVEGYVFRLDLDGKEKWVLWANTTDAYPVAIPSGVVRVTQKEGSASLILDGSLDDVDGRRDGRVTLAVNGSPVFVQP